MARGAQKELKVTEKEIKMKTRNANFSVLFSLGLVLMAFLIFTGCETKENDEWEGFGEGEHFTAPYGDDHAWYLRDNMYPLEECQSCHGVDYSGGSADEACIDCHTNSGGPEACNTCHGNFSYSYSVSIDSLPDNVWVNFAPPANLAGDTATSIISVGAHHSHLVGVQYTDGIPCQSCHHIPNYWADPSHIDSTTAKITFSGLADEDDANPVWNPVSKTCSGTYCHGSFQPVWTTVDSVHSQSVCGTCHDLPPMPPEGPEAHSWGPTLQQCYYCHSQVIDSQGTIINKAKHLNGDAN
jgi:predicted CxxxxCH...CXXCH cytochrome family protein